MVPHMARRSGGQRVGIVSTLLPTRPVEANVIFLAVTMSKCGSYVE